MIDKTIFLDQKFVIYYKVNNIENKGFQNA